QEGNNHSLVTRIRVRRELSACGGSDFERALVFALFIGTGNYRPGFQCFLYQIFAATFRALLREGLVGRGKLALGIVSATVEGVALAAGTLLHYFPVLALRTFHADEVLLHVLAFGVAAARCELAVPAMAQHHVATTLGAGFVQRNVGHFAPLVEPARGLAIGIASTRHELPKTSAFEDHGPPAVLAVFFLCGTLHICCIEVRQINRIFLGEGAGVGILFVVRAARKERPMLAPLDHQR